MKLVFIIGDAAVGKMTVGQELMKITDLRLFHNHMTKRLIDDDNKYRCVSNDGEIMFENYIKIDNSNISAENVAKMIKDRFEL